MLKRVERVAFRIPKDTRSEFEAGRAVGSERNQRLSSKQIVLESGPFVGYPSLIHMSVSVNKEGDPSPGSLISSLIYATKEELQDVTRGRRYVRGRSWPLSG